jgi:hypothetical protein
LYGFDENLSKYYEYPLDKDKENKFIVELKDSKVYSLDIEDISLRIFNDSIGILSLHLNNYDYDESDDILKINEFARRIFPQFLDKNSFVDGTKYSFLPDEVEVILNSKEFSKDNFDGFNEKSFKEFESLNLKEIDKKLLPKYIKKLIGDNIELVLDDRMFVVSFYLDEKSRIIENLKKFDEKSNEYGYVNNDWWYKYVFVDGKDKTCQSKIFCKELIKNSTYDRWVEYGTLWGVSRYSFVGIGSWDLMMIHTKTMYYQMMILLLMYRAMIVYFSDKVQDIVENIKNNDNKRVEIQEKSKNLYGEYLRFLNGLYFKEVTAQEQGIEIYKKAMKIMEIEEYIKDFDREISELDNYIEILVEKERNEELDKLNKLATLFLPPTFIATIVGMNVGSFEAYKEIKFIIVAFLMFLSIIASELVFLSKDDRKITKWLISRLSFLKNIEKYKWWIVWSVLIILALLGLIG